MAMYQAVLHKTHKIFVSKGEQGWEHGLWRCTWASLYENIGVYIVNMGMLWMTSWKLSSRGENSLEHNCVAATIWNMAWNMVV